MHKYINKIGMIGALAVMTGLMVLGSRGEITKAQHADKESITVSSGDDITVSCGDDITVSSGDDITVSCGDNIMVSSGDDLTADQGITAPPALEPETMEPGPVAPEAAEPEIVDQEAVEPAPAQLQYAIAEVENYVNVRNQPSTDGEIVGKIYDGAVATIVETAGEQGDWFRITSGNVEGYTKAEFFLYGQEAAAVLDQYVNRYALVQADSLNVREGQSTESKRIGKVDSGKKLKVLEECGEWVKVQYSRDKEGYVSAQYVVITEEYAHAKTLEEEQAEIAERKKNEERHEAIKNIVFPSTTYSSNEELRKEIVNYAMQFVGDKYVNGGTSLVTGTDCSGFTCFIYADFGYSISRTPGEQFANAGRSIDYSEIQPGDIICYSSNGGKSCTHVAMYIGDGQIVHAANSRKGVIVSNADYEPIIGIRNVID